MARLIRLLIAFAGTGYSGWQRQRHAVTIQGTIEEALVRICGHPLTLHGAGRTDGGVHALGMVAHFETTVGHPLTAFRQGVNSLLPPDIRILRAEEAEPGFHSRFSALAKTYRYDFFTGDLVLPTDRLYLAHLPGPFDPESVRPCLALLEGTHDFSSFEGVGSRQPGSGRGAVRTIFRARLRVNTPTSFSLWLTGDGFLRHMVRNIAGTLRQVGQGKIGPDAFQRILAARDRKQAGPTAPASGLFLGRVLYRARDLEEELQ